MHMITKHQVVYVSHDGTEFLTEAECLRYEVAQPKALFIQEFVRSMRSATLPKSEGSSSSLRYEALEAIADWTWHYIKARGACSPSHCALAAALANKE